MTKYLFKDIVLGEEGLLKGPFGSDLKKSLYVPKGKNTYKVYLQENILKEDNDVGEYYISKEYFDKKMSRYEIKENDFIVTCDGTLGEIFQLKNVKERGIISSSLLRITLNNEVVDSNYFYYLFKSVIKKALITKGNNSVLKHLPGVNIIRNYVVELPEINIQRKIGNVLKTIDNKIKNNLTICKELERMAKIIYEYWFIQYEFPNKDGNPYKLSGGKMIWNEELKKEIPERWNVRKVGDILSKIPNTYKYTSSEYKKDGRFPIIDQSSNYICGYTDKEEDLLKLNDCVVFGDHTKIVKYVNFNFARGADGTQILNSYDDKLPNYLLYMQISNMQLVSQGYSRYFKFLKDKHVIIPEKKISDMYISKVRIALEKIKKCREENKELSNLRDYILPLLMNGQVGF